MKFNIAIKVMIAVTIGFMFWFWAFMVFMVYSFMPASKTFNSIVFAWIAPIIYLVVSTWFISKLFKEKALKERLINMAISIGAMAVSIGIIDLVGRLIR